MSRVRLNNLHKAFGDIVAVRDLDLEIRQGEFFSLLGPSGCGKTTTLRMIAGFEFPTNGQIYFGDRDVTFLKPSLRRTGMVFQNFALFPHMTVFENVAFGLRARKTAKTETKDRVARALKLVDLENMEPRPVTQLSGGQQQRVALARAVVIEPDILLLDEPLSNLDAKLREETREEIKTLQRRLKITTIYVTHDQDEALSLSDRIAVMNRGVCQQVGSPEEIYKRPVNRFVARFVGNSNTLEGKVVATQEDACLIEITPDWRLSAARNSNSGLAKGRKAFLSIKPEVIEFAAATEPQQTNLFAGKILDIKFSGSVIDYEIEAAGHVLRVKHLVSQDDFKWTSGSEVVLKIDPSSIHFVTD